MWLSSCPGYWHARIWALHFAFLVSSFGVSPMERTITQLRSQGAKTFADLIVGPFAFSLKTTLDSEAEIGIEGRVLRVMTLSPLSGTSPSSCNWAWYREVTGSSFHPKVSSGRRSRSWYGGHLTSGVQWQVAEGTEKLGVRGKVLLLHTPPLYT